MRKQELKKENKKTGYYTKMFRLAKRVFFIGLAIYCSNKEKQYDDTSAEDSPKKKK